MRAFKPHVHLQKVTGTTDEYLVKVIFTLPTKYEFIDDAKAIKVGDNYVIDLNVKSTTFETEWQQIIRAYPITESSSFEVTTNVLVDTTNKGVVTNISGYADSN
jgi:hypothetical protein